MSHDDTSYNSVTCWIEDLKKGDEHAAQKLWNRYFERLMRHAAPKVHPANGRVSDEEDIVLAAFDDLFRQAKQGKFPRLFDREDLWALLLTISDRKLINKYRDDNALKRGGHLVIKGDSINDVAGIEDGPRGLEQFASDDPTPEFCEIMQESVGRLMDQLDETHQRVAILKLRNYTNAEIGREMGCVDSTVERRLRRIRDIWKEKGLLDPED